MADRGMTAAMDAAAVAGQNFPVYFVRLDIATDPVLIWTGIGPHTPSSTGDAAFDGQTFQGHGEIGDISVVQDTDKGSGPTTLTLPGVNLGETLLDEIVNNAYDWQWRRAWLWLGYLDSDLNVIIKPVRFKTGRMDSMKMRVRKGSGIVEVKVESHQANISQAQNKTYMDQKKIDPTDVSMDRVNWLMSRPAGAGVQTILSGGTVSRNRRIAGDRL